MRCRFIHKGGFPGRVSSQAELIEKRQRKIALRGKFCPVELQP